MLLNTRQAIHCRNGGHPYLLNGGGSLLFWEAVLVFWLCAAAACIAVVAFGCRALPSSQGTLT